MTALMALSVMSDPQDGPMALSCTSLGETFGHLGQGVGDRGRPGSGPPSPWPGASTLTVRWPVWGW